MSIQSPPARRAASAALISDELTVQDGSIVLRLDPETAAVRQLTAGGVDWLPPGDQVRFAAPFVNGTQTTDVYLKLAAQSLSAGHVHARSIAGRTTLDFRAAGELLSVNLKLPPLVGPRAGLSMDLDLLDLPTGTEVADQVMPHVLYVADDTSYAYFLWHRRNDQYLLMVVDKPFAAWRLKYSFSGHLIQGFQLLAIADDVVTPPGRPLRAVQELSVKIACVASVNEGLAKAADLLNLGMALPRSNGGIVGSRIAFDRTGAVARYIHRRPDGRDTVLGIASHVDLDSSGIHQIIARTADREHITRVFAHESWNTVYDRVNNFYRVHGQHECGAFYTAVHADTLLPDGKTYEGQDFGNPFRSNSCRAGEFGGFGGWAMIKNMLVFGEKPALRAAVDRYILQI